MPAAFKELAGSPVETYGGGGMRATRTLLCAWADRDTLVQDLLGDGAILGGTGVKQYPGKTNVMPVRVRVEPFTDDVTEQELTDLSDGLNAYGGFAKVTVDYEFIPGIWPGMTDIQLQEFTYLSYSCHGAAEAVLMKGSPLFWYNGGSPEAVTEDDLYFVQRVPVVEHHVTWHFVLEVPVTLIETLVGTVNGTAWGGKAAETMLFDNYSISKDWVVMSDLNQLVTCWKVGYVFRERRVQMATGTGGWNHLYRSLPAADVGWDKIQDANGNPPYLPQPTADFNNLFKYLEVATS